MKSSPKRHEERSEKQTTGLAAIQDARDDLAALAERDLKCSKYAEALLEIADQAGDTRG